MKNTSRISLLSVIGILALLSCSRYTPSNSPKAIEDRRMARESRYNLMGFPGDKEIVTADVPAVDDSLKNGGDVVSFPEFVPDNNQPDEVFAVQVFASKSSVDAKKFEQAVAPMFDEVTTTDYKPPYYKVRIGNCSNLEEAEALLEKVKAMGYRNAWLVRITKQ